MESNKKGKTYEEMYGKEKAMQLKKFHSEFFKKLHKKNKLNKGFQYADDNKKKEVLKKIHDKCKENKSGFWNSKTQRELGKKGGKKGAYSVHKIMKKEKRGAFFDPELNRKIRENSLKKNIIFNGIKFDSKVECEIGMCLFYQLELTLEKRKNVHFLVNNKEFDFYVKELNCFVEVHPIMNRFSKSETNESYYKKRRHVLNKNGYKDNSLVVIN